MNTYIEVRKSQVIQDPLIILNSFLIILQYCGSDQENGMIIYTYLKDHMKPCIARPHSQLHEEPSPTSAPQQPYGRPPSPTTGQKQSTLPSSVFTTVDPTTKEGHIQPKQRTLLEHLALEVRREHAAEPHKTFST